MFRTKTEHVATIKPLDSVGHCMPSECLCILTRHTLFGLRMFSSARRVFVRVNYLHLSAAPFEGCLSAASMLHFNLSQEILRKSHKLLTIDTFKFQTCPFLRCHTFHIWTSQRAHLLPPSVWQCLIVPYTLRVSINNCYVFLRTHIVLIRTATASANFCTRLQPAS